MDSIQDARKEPDKLGVILGRAIQAPEDTTGWIRQAFATLGERGLDLPGDQAADVPGALQISVVLRQFWVTSISTNKAANLVLDIQVRRNGMAVLEKSYRGSRTVANWATGQGEVQRLIDGTWANALDQVATDLRTACSS